MAISPKRNNEWAEEMRRIYADAELRMLEKIAKRIARGIDDEGWQERKLAELGKHRDEMNKVIKELRQHGPEALESSIVRGYLAGMISADSDLDHLGVDLPQERISESIKDTGSIEALMKFGMVNVGAVKKLAEASTDNLENAHLQILRNSNDAYRKVIQEVAGSGVVGADTRKQVAQRALARYAGKGVGSFVDKAGRTWDIASYTEMATRTAIGNAQIEGHISRMQEQGRDLVIVSDHPEECSTCAPWERKVLSISGDDDRHKSLRHATSAGLFHPNCGHTINAYIEGLTTDVGNGDSDEDGYEKRQKQRYLERQVRQWKKRQAIAITDQEQAKANAKVKYWQLQLREFTAEHDRRRRYDRESINKPASDNGIGVKSKIGKMMKEDDRKIQAMIAMNAKKEEQEQEIAESTKPSKEQPPLTEHQNRKIHFTNRHYDDDLKYFMGPEYLKEEYKKRIENGEFADRPLKITEDDIIEYEQIGKLWVGRSRKFDDDWAEDRDLEYTYKVIEEEISGLDQADGMMITITEDLNDGSVFYSSFDDSISMYPSFKDEDHKIDFKQTILHEFGHRVHQVPDERLMVTTGQAMLNGMKFNIDEQDWKDFKKVVNKFYDSKRVSVDRDIKRMEYPLNAKHEYEKGIKQHYFVEMFAEGHSIYLENDTEQVRLIKEKFPDYLEFFDRIYKQ